MFENNKHDFNYYIARFFLNNGRLTLLLYILLVTIGTFATFTLKTTGFPNPTINALTIFTRYSGASSQTVLNDISIPLENSIKEVKGIEGYSSSSSNETSVIFINIDSKSNPDTVKADVDSAVSAANLPSKADKPTISKPEISGPDFVFSVVSPTGSLEDLYNTVGEFTANLENLNQTSEVNVINPIKQVVKIKPNFIKITQEGLDYGTLQGQLANFGQSSPIGSDITIDNQSTSINISLPESSLEDLKNFEFAVASAPGATSPSKFVKLSELAEINIDYVFDKSSPAYIGINVNGEKITQEGVIINVKSIPNTDQVKYDQDIKDANASLNNALYTSQSDVKQDQINQTLVLRNYAVKDDNQAQVDEVIHGLIGEPFDIDNPVLAQVGWIFGALQLVFISMFCFVSWRAALISSFSIPLSLGFTSIFLYFTGQSFNTLVLFSLVLVIGLVVDPTLVVLEAIQRKIDSGLKGKEAVLNGFDDVGIGLFTSTLTNIIVFIPFGIISGVIGQIFIYIPLTIVPAIVGSYIIALIFLSWIGGVILKRSPKAVDSEEENLWPIAKWLISLNKRILSSKRIYRLLIIIGTFGLSVAVMATMFGFGFVKQTDFSTPKDSEIIVASYTFKPTLDKAQRDSLKKELSSDLLEYDGVNQVFNYQSTNSLYVQLKIRKNNDRPVSTEIADQMNIDLYDKYKDKLFSLDISSSGPSGGGSEFPIQVGLYPDDLTELRSQALSVGSVMQNICKTDSGFVINVNCNNDDRPITQVDDGFSDQETLLLNIILNRKSILASGLVNTNSITSSQNGLLAPFLSSITPQTDAVIPTDFQKITSVSINQVDVPVIIDTSTSLIPQIKTETQLANSLILNQQTQTPTSLNTVSTVESTSPQQSISRVNGKTILTLQAKVKDEYSDQGSIAQIQQAVFDYYQNDDGKEAKSIGLKEDGVRAAESAQGPDFAQSILELLYALALAIIIIYTILVVFFSSFTKPLVVLYTIPLSFIGLLPALAFLGGGQLGFLEIIGIIILIGLVVNVALYLIDSARSYMLIDGYDQKKAIATASGIRFRSILLTNVTAIAGLAPLAIYSEFYRSIAVVIMFGLLSTGFTSLITTPILFVFFNWLSDVFHKFTIWKKIIFLAPLTFSLPISLWIFFFTQINIKTELIGGFFIFGVLVTLINLIVLWFQSPAHPQPHSTAKVPRKNSTRDKK